MLAEPSPAASGGNPRQAPVAAISAPAGDSQKETPLLKTNKKTHYLKQNMDKF